MRKSKRQIRRHLNELHYHRLFKKLTFSSGFKTSIFAVWDFNRENNKTEYTGRIKRENHGSKQKWMKKYTSKVFRKACDENIKTKGNQYRRYFDYWNTYL